MQWWSGVAAWTLTIVLFVAQGAQARPQPWIGKLEIVLPGLGEAELDSGGGVAVLEQSALQIEALSLAGGLAGATILPVTDPIVSNGGLVGIQVSASLGSGDLRVDPTGFLGGPVLTDGELPLPGELRLCMLVPAPCSGLAMPLTRQAHNGQAGIGIGGLLTVGGLGQIRLSVVGAPWTVNTASVRAQTANGATVTLYTAGFIHGPLSFTDSGAATSDGEGGVIQVVTPIRVTSAPGVAQREVLGGFGRLTLHFVPEPSDLLLIGAGVLALALTARARLSRTHR